MKQLLIVNSSAAYAADTSSSTLSNAKDLSTLAPGAIICYDLKDYSKLTAKATKNFGIALGMGANSPAFVIPEVDINTLDVVRAEWHNGAAFTAKITVPTVVPGKTYTVMLIKQGTVPHERNTWTATTTVQKDDNTTNAAAVATILRNYFAKMAETGSIAITVTPSAGSSDATITITGKNRGEGWVLKGGDAMTNVAPTNVTLASPAIGDKKYVQELASKCAAGKGFTDVYPNGPSIYPGYPEEIYNGFHYIYTLRFKVGRDSSKTRDERVWQLVHIAVPTANTGTTTALDTILNPDSSDDSSSE